MSQTTPKVNSCATGGRVLVIDDEPLLAKVVQHLLEREGFQVAVATSGTAGLDLARSDPPDLVLLDVVMPGMDGFEVCEAIRRDHALCKVPVIILTGMKSQNLNERVFAVGADACMTKPFDPERLLSAVNTALQNAFLKRSNRDTKKQKCKTT